jgi:chromosome segregation ATPase
MSDTPRMDASAHDDGAIWQTGCDIERELNAAHVEIERLTNKVAQLYEGAEEQNDRIKRLEDYGNALVAHVYAYRTQRQWTEESYHDLIQTIADWDKAKATKP